MSVNHHLLHIIFAKVYCLALDLSIAEDEASAKNETPTSNPSQHFLDVQVSTRAQDIENPKLVVSVEYAGFAKDNNLRTNFMGLFNAFISACNGNCVTSYGTTTSLSIEINCAENQHRTGMYTSLC